MVSAREMSLLTLTVKHKRCTHFTRFFAGCMMVICSLFSPSVLAAKLDIIVNQSVNKASFTRTEVREIFTASKQYWGDGSKITVFVVEPSSTIHKAFCREKLQMFPYQVERLWNQITFSGQGELPVRVESQEALIQAVLNTPGAIGYAYQDAFTQVKNKVTTP